MHKSIVNPACWPLKIAPAGLSFPELWTELDCVTDQPQPNIELNCPIKISGEKVIGCRPIWTLWANLAQMVS